MRNWEFLKLIDIYDLSFINTRFYHVNDDTKWNILKNYDFCNFRNVIKIYFQEEVVVLK